MTRLRSGSREALLNVRGFSEPKLADFRERFLEENSSYCCANRLPLDAEIGSRGKGGKRWWEKVTSTFCYLTEA